MRGGAATGVDVADDQVEGILGRPREDLARVSGTDPDPRAALGRQSPPYEVDEGGSTSTTCWEERGRVAAT